MAEFNRDVIDPIENGVVVYEIVQPHHALAKTNRLLTLLILALLAVVFVMGIFLLPHQNVLEKIGHTQVTVATQNPAISDEISTLKEQMFGLVSGSIEGKIKSLEDNIRRGKVGDSLETLQQLKSDVKILGDFSQKPFAKVEQTVVDQQVIKELSELKGLVYLTIASCGLMMAAFAGIWLRNRYRLNHLQSPKAHLRYKE